MFDAPIHVIDFEGSQRVVSLSMATLRWRMVRLSIRRRESALPLVRLLTSTGASTVSLKDALQNVLFELEWSLLLARLRQSGAFCAHNASVEDFYAPSGFACRCPSPDFAGTWTGHRNMGAAIRSIFIGKFTRSSKTINFKRSSKSLTFRLLDAQAVTICPTERP